MRWIQNVLGGGLVLALALALGQATPGGPGAADDLQLVASQSAALTMHPQIAHVSKSPAMAGVARSAMTAKFRPVRKGRVVYLQQRRGTRWVTVRKGRQNARGHVDFVAPYKYKRKIAVYRAVAARHNGLSRIASRAKRTSYWGRPDFQDNFGGDTLSSAWTHRTSDYSSAANRSCSRVERGSAKDPVMKGRTLLLRVTEDPDKPTTTLGTVKNCPVTGTPDWRVSNSIGTQGTRSFRYGYAAARIKFQARDGVHAGFWLNSSSTTKAEIDIVEWFGNRRGDDTEIQHCLYHWVDGQPVKEGGFLKNNLRFGSDWSSKYHVFSVEWTPRIVIYRIDGRETYRITRGVSQEPMHLVLSLFSSDWEYKRTNPSELPVGARVDWVRFWDRDRTS